MFHHHDQGCACGNRSRYSAMCPKQNGFCFPVKQNVARGLFGKGCSNMQRTTCVPDNSRAGSCPCRHMRMQNTCGCSAFGSDYRKRKTYEASACACHAEEKNESHLNPVCPCQRARIEEGYMSSRMEMGGSNVSCNVREFPSAVPDCDVTVKPNTYRVPTPTAMPENPVYAMTYTKMQDFNAMYTPSVAIMRGTAFPCLDKPFCGETVGEAGGCGCKGGRY